MQTDSVNSIYNAKLKSIASRLPSGVQTFASTLKQTRESSASSPTPVTSSAGKPMKAQTVKPNQKLIPVVFNAHSLDYKSTPTTAPVNLSSFSFDDGTMDLRNKIAEFAKQFQGTPYVWGGEDLQNGADCSGYMQSVFKTFDIELPRTAYYQSKEGENVDLKNIRTGDLLFFKTADYAPVTHVGMYIGNNQFIHASSSKGGVVISDLSSRWERKIVNIKSFI